MIAAPPPFGSGGESGSSTGNGLSTGGSSTGGSSTSPSGGEAGSPTPQAARALLLDVHGARRAHLSQRALAKLLGVSQPRVVELESGEKNPRVETLVKIAAATGLEFAIDIAPAGQEPRLVGKAVKDSPAHVYAGASLLVASR